MTNHTKGLLFFLLFFSLCNHSFSQMPAVGQKAPEIIFSSAIGKDVSPDYLKNKTVVLDFWTTWCGPCIASFPAINKLVEEYKSRPSVVFACINYEAKSKVETFFKQRKKTLNALKLIDKDSTTNKSFGVTAFPQTFIIDAKGIVRWSGNIETLTAAKIDSICITEYSQTSNSSSGNTVTASPDVVQQFFSNLDSLNKETGMLLFTRKSGASPISTLKFDPGKMSGKFLINAIGNRLIRVISFTTASQREAKMSILNREKGDYYIDALFQVETAYMKGKEFESFENMYFQNSRELNFFLYSLSKKYNFSCQFKKMLFDTYELRIADSVLVKNYFTINTSGLSRSDIKKNVLEVSNYDLASVYKELKNSDILVSGLSGLIQKFDLTLNMNSIDELKKSFREQGFELIDREKVEKNVFEIVFK